MMDSPQFFQHISGVMSNLAVLDQIIVQNPQLAAMGPQVREVFQNDRFRELIDVRYSSSLSSSALIG
jgi:ubiquilin